MNKGTKMGIKLYLQALLLLLFGVVMITEIVRGFVLAFANLCP